MSYKVLEKGVIDQTFYLELIDTNTNLGMSGLVASTSGLQAFYVRDRGASVNIPLVSQTITGAHTDGGFIEVNPSMRGVYRFDSTDAPFAVGSSGVVFQLQGAANMLDCAWFVELVDPISSSNPIPAQTVSFGTQAVGSLQDRFNEYGALRPSVSGRLIDVSATGEAGIDWNNIGTPTATVALTNTTVSGVISMAGQPSPSVADIWSYMGGGGRMVSGIVSMQNQPMPSSQDIWSYVSGPGRTITSIGTPAASGIWGHATRTLTSGGAGGATAQEVWEYATRAITDKAGFSITGTKTTLDALNDVSASGVWGNAVRTLTEKTGFSIAGTKTTLDALNDPSAPTIASAVLTSGISNFEATATARSLTGAIAKLTNRVARTADTTLTVYRTDDSSTMFTQTLTASGATPIMSADTN